jgi:hypothetical protein
MDRKALRVNIKLTLPQWVKKSPLVTIFTLPDAAIATIHKETVVYATICTRRVKEAKKLQTSSRKQRERRFPLHSYHDREGRRWVRSAG